MRIHSATHGRSAELIWRAGCAASPFRSGVHGSLRQINIMLHATLGEEGPAFKKSTRGRTHPT